MTFKVDQTASVSVDTSIADTVLLTSFTVSLASLIVAVYVAYNARRVYRASLQPIVDVNFSVHYSSGGAGGNPTLPPRPALILKNTGKGTARFLHPVTATLEDKRWYAGVHTHELQTLEAGSVDTMEMGAPSVKSEFIVVVTFKDVLNKVFRTMAHFTFDSDNGDWWEDGESKTFSTDFWLKRTLEKWMGADASELTRLVRSHIKRKPWRFAEFLRGL